ncbi:MFS transporter [Paraflavitalea sp. CAU 1676]|uniref:MFS transporter n=1 Tax=Paraflavitalea sp. CAU 1676 TaxID=3032598 RepID=UPI0023DCB476|nr:MFS transporter [Paraflavitalea sp. CAU 1676]MDF2188098.1 MFS transporter [Paraflavitalea sp. CAU 1676]
MLPALAQVRHHFGLTPESTDASQIITFFFTGQVAQIIFGILSDRYGRLPILRLGFPLYIVGGIAATYAPSLTVMYVARFIAGMGASAVLMTTIAGVRDRFVGDQMARVMSLVFTIFLFVPILAPFLGMAILSVASWKVVFLTPPLFAVLIFAWSLRLEESLPRHQRTTLKGTVILQSIRQVLSNKTFLRYTITTTILFSTLSSFVSSSEHMVGEIYGRPQLFPWIFGGIGLLMACFTLMNARFSARFGARRSLKTLLLVYAAIATLLFAFTLATGDPPPMGIFFAAIALLMGINLAIEPNSSALALEPLGNLAGLAASVYGTIFFFIGGSLGSIISVRLTHGVWPLVLSYFIIGFLTIGLVFSDRRPLQ